MENENVDNTNNVQNENVTNENQVHDENVVENETTEEIQVVVNTNEIDYTEKLDMIHEDLGYINSFLLLFLFFASLVVIYRFFSMFFKI